MWCTHLVKPLTIITCLSLIFGRVRSPVVGHESDGPQVVFNVHQLHRHDSTHPSLFYRVGYHSYICGVQHSWAQSCITLWSNASRTVTHPCINRARDCLTSVIKHKTFAPCYVSHMWIFPRWYKIPQVDVVEKSDTGRKDAKYHQRQQM